MSAAESPLERLAALSYVEREELIADEARKHGLSPQQLKAMLLRSWRFVGRPKQQAPQGDWTFWGIIAGRGFGKTLSAAQWIKERGLERKCRVALIAPTRNDVRTTMVEGETGLLSVLPNDALWAQSRDAAWNRTFLELTLANGTVLTGFSSEEPDRLRGPQHDYAWCEEFSSWKDARLGGAVETTWSNMTLGLRLGPHPQAVLTSTPKTNKLTREVLAMPEHSLVAIRGSSYENRQNLAQSWWDAIVAPLEGTRAGRQEIEAELLEDVEGALWTRAMIDVGRVEFQPPMSRIVVAVDPNTTSGEAANDAGVIVVGKGQRDRHGYVLDDRTVVRGGPAVWAQVAADAYHDWKADRIVAEKNAGGEMVEMVIKSYDPSVPVKLVNASRGKRTRAEPIATLYERKDSDGVPMPQVHHVGPASRFELLEDEMVTWTPEGESPNRLDALVWGITDLEIWKPEPRPARSSVPRGQISSIDPRTGLSVIRPRTY